jgi:nitric oxide dioxygenase
MMDLHACRRITASYDAIADRIDQLVQAFYRRLFERAPEIRRLFKEDMTIQREHLAASLALIARNIDHLDILAEPLEILGVEHVAFGAKPPHYLIVRDAMMDALAEALGDRFTEELRADWFAALNQVIALMLKGAITAARDAAHP